MVGRFFHSVNENGKIMWQGQIVGNPHSDYYLVELFDWLVGGASVQRLIRLEEMESWLFYPDSNMMMHAYDYGIARAGGPYRPDEKKTA